MVKTLTGKFKVETVWPELINKRVRQIDSCLKEIQFFNQGNSLLAKGSFKRQVKYLDSGGKIKKTEDRLQFEVTIGTALPEPLPYFISELKSDYFIFQPRRLGAEHALLEQGFTLIINEFEGEEVEANSANSFAILTEAIVDRGKSVNVYCLPLGLRRDSHPKKFNGKLIFERSKPPLVMGIITGVVVYRNSRQILKELEVNHSFSFLMESAPKETESELIVNGTIAAVNWVSPTGGQGWMAELKLDYNWNLVINKELTVLGRNEGSNQSEPLIKADLLIKEERWRFSKSYKVESKQAESFEVEPEIKRLDWQRIGLALLISATLSFDLFLSDVSGTEKYRTISFEMEELTEGFFEKDNSHGLTLNLDPRLSIEKTTATGDFFIIDCTLNLTAKLYQTQEIYLIQENATTEINGLIPITNKNFSLFSETLINLRYTPRKIIQVRNRILHHNPSSKKGWLNLYGLSETAVIYLDRQNQYREEYFNLPFEKSFCWEAIDEDEGYQIDLQEKLEYDSYRIEDNRLHYKYLRTFTASAFSKRIIKAAVLPMSKDMIAPTAISQLRQNPVQEILIQGEVLLQFGNPREITGSRGSIAAFNWRDALNAILVEGKIKGEIEYWDDEGFLRCEALEFSFWRFLDRKEQFGENAVLVPLIRRFSYLPLRPWPWRKGAVRYQADIEITT
jgi:hypothetical protein